MSANLNTEHWQETLIRVNLPTLIKTTDCNVSLISILQSKKILGDADLDDLETTRIPLNKNKKLYDIIKARKTLVPLIEALQENEQTVVCDILLKGLVVYKFVKFQTIDIILNKILLHYKAPIPETTENLYQDLVKKEIPILVNNHVETTPKYYIQRVISRSRLISKDIFQNPGKDVFAIKGLDRFELTTLANGMTTDVSSNQDRKLTAQFILLDNDSHFDKICKKSKEPVHLIDCTDKQFNWIKTKGSMAKIRNYLSKEQTTMSEEEFGQECLQLDDPVIIADAPGIGKSFFLTKMAQGIMDKGNIQLVRFLQFRDFIKTLKRPITEDSVCNAIAEVSSVYEVGQEVVQRALKSEDTVSYLFLDGFDEVSSEQVPVVGEILNCTRLLKKTRVYTATRSHMKQELEDMVGVLGFNMLPFQENEQIDFLVKVWQDEAMKEFGSDQITSVKRLKKFATVCLRNLKHLTARNDSKEIAGIPLLCSILARVHQENAIDYSRDQSINAKKISPTTWSIFEIYKDFMNKGFDKIATDYHDKIKAHHDILAVEELFLEWKDVLTPSLKNDGKELNYRGLYLTRVVEPGNNNASFVHRTFAEYLVAEFIAGVIYEEPYTGIWDQNINELVGKLLLEDVLATRQKDEPIQLRIGKKVTVTLYEFKQPNICYFLNGFGLSQAQATASDSRQTIKKELNPVLTYTAALVSNIPAIEKLLTIDSECTHLGWPELFISASKYAGVKMASHLTELLHKSSRKLPADLKYPELQQVVVTPLHFAAQRGNYNLFTYLWDNGGFRKSYNEGIEDVRFLLHECVSGSCSESQKAVTNKVHMVNLILSDVGKGQPKTIAEKNLPYDGSNPQHSIHGDLLKVLTSNGFKFTQAKVHPLLMNIQGNVQFAKMYSAVVAIDNPAIGHLLIRLFESEGETLLWPELLLLAAKYAGVEMTRQLIKLRKSSVGDELSIAELKYPGDEIVVTPLHVAVQSGNYNLFEYLWNRGGFRQLFLEEHKNIRYLVHECVSGSSSETQEVVRNKFNIINLILCHKGTRETIVEERIPYDNSTPLLQPNIHIELLKFLISKDAQLTHNKRHENALHIAAMNGNVSVVEFLIKYHPHLVKMLDVNGNTPLHLSVLKRKDKHCSVQKILIEGGADIYAVNERGDNPFVNGMKHGKGLELIVVKAMKNRHKKFLSAFGGVGLKSVLTNSNLMVWDWDESLIAVVEYLIGKGAIVQCMNNKRPWDLEQVVSNMGRIVKTAKFTDGLLQRLKKFDISHKSTQSKAETLKKMRDLQGSYEQLMVSLVKDKQMKPFQIMKQFIQANENESVWFVTPPLGLLDFILNKETKVFIITSHNSTYTATRIRHTVCPDTVIHEGLDTGLRVIYFPSHEKLNKMMPTLLTVGYKIICIANETFTLEKFNHDQRKVIGTAYDEVRWDDLSGLVRSKLSSLIEQCEEFKNCSFFCFLVVKYIVEKQNYDFPDYKTKFDKYCEHFVKYIFRVMEQNKVLQFLVSLRFQDWAGIFKENKGVSQLKIRTSRNGDFEILLRDLADYLVALLVVNDKYRDQLDSEMFVKFVGAVVFKCENESGCPTFVNHKICGYVNVQLKLNEVNVFKDLLNSVDKVCFKNLILGCVQANCFEMLKVISRTCESRKIPVEVDERSMSFIIMNSSLEWVKYFNDIYAKMNERLIVEYNNELWSTLRLAAHRGDREVFKYMVEYHEYNLELIEQLRSGSQTEVNARVLKTLVKNVKVEKNDPEVISIIKTRNIPLLYLAIDFGSDARAQDEEGFTMLHRAPEYLTPEQFHKLVEHLVRINKTECFKVLNRYRANVLHLAVFHLEVLPETLDLFKSQNVDFNAITNKFTNFGSSVLHCAVKGNRSTKVLKKLVECGSQVGATNKNGNGLLHYAAKFGNSSAIWLLVSLGCSVTLVNELQRTPLHEAFFNNGDNFDEVVRVLVEHKADVNAKGQFGRTPLHYAVEHCKSSKLANAIRFLISNGADVNMQDIIGDTMLLVPLKNRTASDYHQIVQIVNETSPECLKKRDRYRRTALHRAIYYLEIQSDTLEILIKHVDINAVNIYGDPSIFYAIWRGRSIEIIKMLIDHGADPKMLNNCQSNALHLAAMYGYVTVLEYFLRRREVGVNEKNKDGDTPLHCALIGPKDNVHEVVRILLEAGGDVNVTNGKGRSPLDDFVEAEKSNKVEGRTVTMMKTLELNLTC